MRRTPGEPINQILRRYAALEVDHQREGSCGVPLARILALERLPAADHPLEQLSFRRALVIRQIAGLERQGKDPARAELGILNRSSVQITDTDGQPRNHYQPSTHRQEPFRVLRVSRLTLALLGPAASMELDPDVLRSWEQAGLRRSAMNGKVSINLAPGR